MDNLEIITIWLKLQRISYGLNQLIAPLELTQELDLIQLIEDILVNVDSWMVEFTDRLGLETVIMEEISLNEILNFTPVEVLKAFNLETDPLDFVTFNISTQYESFLKLKDHLTNLRDQFELSNIDSDLISFLEYLEDEVNDLLLLLKSYLDSD